MTAGEHLEYLCRGRARLARDLLPRQANDEVTVRRQREVASAIGVEGAARVVDRRAIEFDHESRLRPERVDFDKLAADRERRVHERER